MAAGSISYDEYRSLVENFVDISNKIDDKWHLECGPQGTVYMCKKCVVVPKASRQKNPMAWTTNDDESPPVGLQQPPISPLVAISSSSSCPSVLALELTESTPASVSHLKDAQLTGGEKDMEDLNCLEMEDEDDDSCMPVSQTSQNEPLTYEFHVLYSESYGVPVLYFSIFTSDGKLLPLEEVWKSCPSAYQKHLAEHKWATLTQQEHPFLGRPYFQLHPCHTADLMAQVTARSEDGGRRNYLATWLSTVGPLVGLGISPNYISFS